MPHQECPRDGSRALHWAAQFGSSNVAGWLLAAGADPLALDAIGRLPIHWAAGRSLETCKLLACFGGLDAVDAKGRIPLVQAALRPLGDQGSESFSYLLEQTPKAVALGVVEDVVCELDRILDAEGRGAFASHWLYEHFAMARGQLRAFRLEHEKKQLEQASSEPKALSMENRL